MSADLARTLRALSVSAVVAVAALIPVASVGAAADDASAFVQRLGDEVVEFMRRTDLTPSVRRERLRQLLAENIDLKSVRRAALGRYWRMASDAQRARYEASFTDYVLARYGGLFENYTGVTLKVTGSEPVGDDDVLVNGDVERAAGPPIKMAFRVRNTNDGYRVLDVLVEGVSLLVTQRSEFAAVIGREGMDGFLARLEEVTREVSPTSEPGQGASEKLAVDD